MTMNIVAELERCSVERLLEEYRNMDIVYDIDDTKELLVDYRGILVDVIPKLLNIMTLEEQKELNSTFNIMDSTPNQTPARDKPMIHPAVDPPLCALCLKMEMSFFDPNCPGCHEVLINDNTSVAEIFAVLRQWTPQTQQNLEILVREVLRRGANVNDRDGLTDMTLLHYAAKAGANGVGDVDEACRVVNLLLSKGANVFVRCRWTNMTALHYATYFDVSPVVKVLLKSSKAIDVDSACTEFDRGTPLHIAAANLSTECIILLLQNGSDPAFKDDLGRQPIDCVPDISNFEEDSDLFKQVVKIKKMLQEAETTKTPITKPPPTYNDEQAKAVLQSLGLKIADKVLVGGVKTGLLRYCGQTEFASGVWAGIELDEPAGKNDGSVGGIAYFRCSPKYGIFAPINKISKPGILLNHVNSSMRNLAPHKSSVSYKKVDTSHVTARVDTADGTKAVKTKRGEGLSRRSLSTFVLNPNEEPLEVGDRVIVAGQRRGIIRFGGETDFAPGWWYGIELDRPVGRNDGGVNGRRYFSCKPKYGVFAPPTRLQKVNDIHGSHESLESPSASFTERQRKVSNGSTGSQQSLSTTPSTKKSNIRPKSSGTLGLRRTSLGTPEEEFKLREGMSVFCNNELGVIRYIGPVEFSEGVWLGIELRVPKGKNDGSVQGKRYFTCKNNHGLVVRPSKVTVRGINGAKLLSDNYNSSSESSK